jgi:uncharacterized hydrophobic protein (TIGR00341 family)
MTLRFVEIFLPQDRSKEAHKVLSAAPVSLLGAWESMVSEKQALVRVLVSTEQTEVLLDMLDRHFSRVEGYRIILLPVEATLPRPQPNEEAETEEAGRSPTPQRIGRVSREELYAKISEGAAPTTVFVVMLIFAATVAAGGLLHTNMAVIIGAMVMAPLLGPNVALSLATTLGDASLIRRSIQTNVVGLTLALLFAAALGFVFPVDPKMPEIALRTQVSLTDVILALVSGSAGALSFTTAAPSALVGVMVAVALLPPAVAAGLLLGAAHWESALRAMELLATNVVCVNLAGVATFLAQGVRPNTWWEAERARNATRIAMTVWLVLLAVVVAMIVLWGSRTRLG